MTLTPARLGNMAVAFLAVMAVVVAALTSEDTPQQSVTVAGSSTTTLPSYATAPTAGATVDVELIKAQAKSFIEAFNLIEPTDTEEARRNRVRPFVTDGWLNQAPLGLSEGSDANNARKQQGLIVRAEVLLERLSVAPSAVKPAEIMIVSGEYTIRVTDQNGTQINRGDPQFASQWVFRDGKWLLLDFRGGGGSE